MERIKQELHSKKKARTSNVTVKTSVRVPKDVWDRVRMEAIRRGMTTQALVAEAIDKMLEGAR